MSDLPIEYDIAVEGEGGQVKIRWGEEAGWADVYRQQLDLADRVSLIPKRNGLPVVTAKLDGDKRWVVFSRVFGKIHQGNGEEKRIRCYCVGWQQTVRGVNVKALQWVYPTGAVECADEPSFVNQFLR